MHSVIYLALGLLLSICSNCLAQRSIEAVLIEADLDGCDADCPVIPLPNYYVFCLQAVDKFYIGGHQSWDLGLKKLASLEGRTLPLRIDEAHLWVKLPSGWEVKLNKFDYEYPFKDKGCRAAAQERSFERGYTRPASVPGEPAMPVVHGKFVFGWALCSAYLKNDNFLDCTVWDLKGDIRQRGTYRRVHDRIAPEQAQAWGAASEGAYRVLHLRDGQILQLLDFTHEVHR